MTKEHSKTGDPAVGSTRLVSTFRYDDDRWKMWGLETRVPRGKLRLGIIRGPIPTFAHRVSRSDRWQVRVWKAAIAFRANE